MDNRISVGELRKEFVDYSDNTITPFSLKNGTVG
jgi:hypothetical protein